MLSIIGAGCGTCAPDWLLLPGRRESNALKNRTALPTEADRDRGVSLEALLRPGDDEQRWSPRRAAVVEGVIVRVVDADPESANCFSRTRVDAHVEIATTIDAPVQRRVITEITPSIRDWAASRGLDWSTPTLQRTLTGQRVRLGGWLFFDQEHASEAENTRPGRRENWRATAWELHPITAIELLRP